MPHDQAYHLAEMRIEAALKSDAIELDLSCAWLPGYPPLQLTELPETLKRIKRLQRLNLSTNLLESLPEWLGQLTSLQELNLSTNRLSTLPESLGQLTNLQSLILRENNLTGLPESFWNLTRLKVLELSNNQLSGLSDELRKFTILQSLTFHDNRLTSIPEFLGDMRFPYLHDTFDISSNSLTNLPNWLEHLIQLKNLNISHNRLTDLPEPIGKLKLLESLLLSYNELTDLNSFLINLKHLKTLKLDNNPLNPELTVAYNHGLGAVKVYLQAKAKSQIKLNEAKLIIIGEGEVGKTCLMDALLDNNWQEHDTTHGIQIKQIKITDADSNKKITLNSWDFGGQRVYRPTHQLFFSAPAVYLVVWKPREGPQQGFIKEWIQLIKRREPSAKILIVATHGGPQQRQPDIDRQELWDLFGKETIIDFFFVDSKPDEHGHRKGIEELKRAIARTAATLPDVGRSVPKSFADVRTALAGTGKPYLPLDEVFDICRAHYMDDETARLFITISHCLGHLTHYENDPALRDIVILRPDWLAAAMSFVLDDEQTRLAHGLVKFSRLGKLWDDFSRPADSRYPATLHPIFLRLMERFDLSYRVADLSPQSASDPLSLIGQLVPDIRPTNVGSAWPIAPSSGDLQQIQICRIVDRQTGQSASAEGLFYQLIVRLHKYSLGRVDYTESVHWQRGLIIEDEYKNRAFLEHVGNDIRITVRSPYPEGLLGMLTREVKFLVESFWEGLKCEVTVPCLNPTPCKGLFEVSKLMESKREGQPKYPCPICNNWQNIDTLLRNAPDASIPIPFDALLKEFAQIKDTLNEVNYNTRRILGQVDKNFDDLIHLFTDEAKEGPRLFSFFPLDRSNFNPKEWVREKFRLVLWCEHSRLPLPMLNNGNMKKGVYDLDINREWFKKAGPYLKFLIGTLGMVLPVASSAVKLQLDETSYKLIEEQLDFGKSVIDASIGEVTKVGEFFGAADTFTLEYGVAIRAESSTLHELHALLKAKDSSFGGLVRVLNKRNEFLWVHPKFKDQY